MEDEYSENACPHCGYDPYECRWRELQEDVADYVDDCVERGERPDAFAFSLMYRTDYGDVPGDMIAKLIDRELSERQ